MTEEIKSPGLNEALWDLPPGMTAEEAAKERAETLHKMRRASDLYYALAAQAGCHAFIEFAGLMNEFIKVCEDAHKQGIDFTMASTHTDRKLPFKPYHLQYLAEKLNCIYGPTLLSDETNRRVFISTLFEGEYRLQERQSDE